jgi:small-conductance mechanosensitive channel
MLDTLGRTKDVILDWLSWLPGFVIVAIVLIVVVLIALALHGTVRRVVRRLLHGRPAYVISFFAAARGVSRLALVILALSLVLPLLPLDRETTLAVAKMLLVATIVLIGWIALIAVDVAAKLYLMRFRLDSGDNLSARKHITQIHILRRTAYSLVVLLTVGFALMTFEPVREYGLSLFASAGVAGLVAGLAARPLLSSLIAGVQIAITQPIRIDDEVVVEGETGRIEEITSTYVVIKLWDLRRLIVPLSYFMEKPFQNWTRDAASMIGAVTLHADYSAPIARIREKALELIKASPLWDGGVAKLDVIDSTDRTIKLRALMSARNSSSASDLSAELREKLIAFLQKEYPGALPRSRNETLPSPRPDQ